MTFLVEDEQESDGPPINVTSNGIKINAIGAAKEHQLSIGLDEVPRQVQTCPGSSSTANESR